jgi:hypothetical protein
MPLRKIDARYVRRVEPRLHQGDILRDVVVLERVVEGEEGLEIQNRTLPYVVVLTQDCDLEQDFCSRADPNRMDCDKFLLTVLMCPAYPAAKLREGTHLGDEHPMQRLNGDLWKRAKANQSYRYHFLETETSVQVPELVLDFKQYFTLPRDEACKYAVAPHYVATANAIFRENLCRRFADYLTRIALPELEPAAMPAP